MQARISIGFEDLVQLVKKLPSKQWTKLKYEVDKEKSVKNEPFDLTSFLLSAPTFSKKQLAEIAKTRKEINLWRTK